MIEQLAGALLWAGVFLAYVLIVQAMMAAIVLMAQFTVLQWRELRRLLADPPGRAVAVPQVEHHDQAPAEPYRVGGGVKRW